MNQNNIIAYAASFVSFLLDDRISRAINRIILFGSVARGTFDEESDIDLFIDTKEDIEKDIQNILRLFQGSEIQKRWGLKGIVNEISLKVGDLNKWKLKRDIISDGIVLYGKVKDVPENIEYYLLITPSFKRFRKSQNVKLWRKLYGYRQKVGTKVYKTIGLLEKLNGKRIENGIVVKMSNKKDLIDFLNKEKISCKIIEIWSDSLA